MVVKKRNSSGKKHSKKRVTKGPRELGIPKQTLIRMVHDVRTKNKGVMMRIKDETAINFQEAINYFIQELCVRIGAAMDTEGIFILKDKHAVTFLHVLGFPPESSKKLGTKKTKSLKRKEKLVINSYVSISMIRKMFHEFAEKNISSAAVLRILNTVETYIKGVIEFCATVNDALSNNQTIGNNMLVLAMRERTSKFFF